MSRRSYLKARMIIYGELSSTSATATATFVTKRSLNASIKRSRNSRVNICPLGTERSTHCPRKSRPRIHRRKQNSRTQELSVIRDNYIDGVIGKQLFPKVTSIPQPSCDSQRLLFS